MWLGQKILAEVNVLCGLWIFEVDKNTGMNNLATSVSNRNSIWVNLVVCVHKEILFWCNFIWCTGFLLQSTVSLWQLPATFFSSASQFLPSLSGSGSQKVMEMFLYPHEALSIAGHGCSIAGAGRWVQLSGNSQDGLCTEICLIVSPHAWSGAVCIRHPPYLGQTHAGECISSVHLWQFTLVAWGRDVYRRWITAESVIHTNVVFTCGSCRR